MIRGRNVATVLAVLLSTAFLDPLLQARTCSGNGDLIGAYGFIGSRDSFFLLGATPPGTTAPPNSGPLVPVAVTPPGTNPNVSNTSIGALIGGLLRPYVFSASGRVLLDGA